MAYLREGYVWYCPQCHWKSIIQQGDVIFMGVDLPEVYHSEHSMSFLCPKCNGDIEQKRLSEMSFFEKHYTKIQNMFKK